MFWTTLISVQTNWVRSLNWESRRIEKWWKRRTVLLAADKRSREHKTSANRKVKEEFQLWSDKNVESGGVITARRYIFNTNKQGEGYDTFWKLNLDQVYLLQISCF